jgi:hypothetical protein
VFVEEGLDERSDRLGAAEERKMSHVDRRPADYTGEAAVGDVASVSLFGELVARIDDKTDQVLLLARVGLEYSERNLSQALNMEKSAVDLRIQEIIAALRSDQALAAKLEDVRRAGRPENYLALALQLGLQDWFCSWCEKLMVQSERGARRKTCGDSCRLKLFRAGGVGWKNKLDEARSPAPSARIPTPAPLPSTFAAASDDVLGRLMWTVDKDTKPAHVVARTPKWWEPHTRLRDRAMLLLGLTCEVGLTPMDIASLDVDDVVRTAKGLELRLYRNVARPVRYVTVAVRQVETVCPAAAVMAWKRELTSARPGPGPLFVRLNNQGCIGGKLLRITGHAVASIADIAVARTFQGLAASRQLSPIAPVLSLLK